MSQPRTFNSYLKNCTPVGTVHSSPESVALEVRQRLKMWPDPSPKLTVFVAREKLFPTPTHGPMAELLDADQIVGTYTTTSRASEIAEDVREYAKGCAA